MRIFKTMCIDDKTRYEMVASECSYNMACDWLQNEISETGAEIYRTEYNYKTELYELWTGIWDEHKKDYVDIRKFFFDEERGYLLGE